MSVQKVAKTAVITS